MYFVFVLLPVMHFLLCCKFLTCSRVVCFPELSQLHLDESDSADASIYDLKFFLNHQVLVFSGESFFRNFYFQEQFFFEASSEVGALGLVHGPWTVVVTVVCVFHCFHSVGNLRNLSDLLLIADLLFLPPSR